jgi:hypothetical protein
MLLTLVFTALIMLSGISYRTVQAQAGGGNEDCPATLELLEKYNWTADGYIKDGTPGTNVTVLGNAVSGTFTVVNGSKLVYEVIVKGSNNAKNNLYPDGVSSGTFNNTGLINNGGQTADISNIKFCGKDKPVEPRDDYYFTIAKDWNGDKDGIDTNLLEDNIVFTVNGKQWKLGDEALPVEPGDVLNIIESEIQGLPTECSSQSDLVSPVTIPGNNDVLNLLTVSNSVLGGSGSKTDPYLLTVTNTIACEDEEEPEVPVVVPETPTNPTTVTPVSATVTSNTTATPTVLPETGTKENVIIATTSAVAGILAILSIVIKSTLVRFY